MAKKSSRDKWYEFAKRTVDVVGSVLILIIFSPIMIAIAIAIKITSPGPVLVEAENKHMKRMGKGGKIFRLYKFRSMMVKADVLERTDPKYKKAFEQKRQDGNWKPKDDPRVTLVGKFIRKYSVDETPQLMNVLMGDMSIVGPRPYLPDELKEQTAKYPGTEGFVKEVHTVKPGITGYWQVNGRSNVGFDRRIEMDAYYARKKSIILDILIMIKTPIAMLTATGAV